MSHVNSRLHATVASLNPHQPRTRLACLIGLVCTGLAASVSAQTNLYWGDLHLHSNYSLDAYGVGNTSVTPDMAYRFARGIPILHPVLETKVQIDRPLDFLAVTDHSDNLGVDVQIKNADPLLQATARGRELIAAGGGDKPWAGLMRFRPTDGNRAETLSEVTTLELRQSAWQKEIEAADKNNVPGTFTTFFAWEWTAMIDGKNLHRNVISNANTQQAGQFYPYGAGQFHSLKGIDSNRPEDLWQYLTDTSKRTGVDFIAIPHNSNLSGGLMFDIVDSDGRSFTADYARKRMRWESLVEITQTKGTSEVLPELAPTDEFAEFEIRRKLLIGTPTPPSPADYVRSALLRGLTINHEIGVNPYKFGVIGATDNHIGMTTVDERNFLGKIATDSRIQDHLPKKNPVIFPAWEMSASGLTGVWAEKNTRESLFAAMKRKEVYGTTGTRMSLRVFGGFNFVASDARANDIAAVGYKKGVPMGSDLTAAPKGKAPGFLIHAAKDPVGANLDRIQVVKGWLDDKNQPQEHVYDVAWSGNRKPGANGKVPAVGNTVDISTALYTNDIGEPQLATVWTDPDFKSSQNAFYYVRVLEIPTPRQSLFDAVALNVDVSITKEAATLQERAYSSPIWYSP